MPVLQMKPSTQRSTVYLDSYADMVRAFVERYTTELGGSLDVAPTPASTTSEAKN